MFESTLRRSGGTVVMAVVAIPGAARTDLAGVDPWRHALKIRIAAKATGGAANEELVRFLADDLRLPRSSVRITSGQTGRKKTVALLGIDVPEAVRRLGGDR